MTTAGERGRPIDFHVFAVLTGIINVYCADSRGSGSARNRPVMI